MPNTKVYKIEINGLTESTNAVNALNDSLNALEQRMKRLQNASINVSSGGGGKSSTLKEEDTLLKQIQKTEVDIANAQREEYQNLLANKELLKQTRQEAEQRAAAERMAADNYANSMEGMKQKLADIKKVMQTTDIGSDKFKELTVEANNLNTKLLDIEKSYGQFGRNVGNYESAANGFKKISLEINGVNREFANAREASRELGNELKTMALNGQQDTVEFKNLQTAVAQLNSDIKDATVSSKAMDNMLDTLQSMASIGSITQGFSALMGFDDSEIEKSIQKLVALQNVMKGFEQIKQQMMSGEGIGGWLAKGNDAIDNFVKNLTDASTATETAKKAQDAINASIASGATVTEKLATATKSATVATKDAAVATKEWSLALKTIGIGLVITLIATLITYWDDLEKYITDTVPALKNITSWFDKFRAVAVGVGTALVNLGVGLAKFIIKPFDIIGKVIQALIEKRFKEIPNIIKNGLKELNVVANFQKGYYKETERQQKAHLEKLREEQREANEELLKDEEAKYGKSHARTQKYLRDQMALVEKGSKKYKELQRQLWEDERREREELQKKSTNKSKDTAKKDAEYEREVARLRIEAMKDGLNKTIAQLEEERKDRLSKLDSNARDYKEKEYLINTIYDKKIEEERQKHYDKLEKIEEEREAKLHKMQLKQKELEWENREKENQATANYNFAQNVGSYGIQGKNQISPSTREQMGIVSEKMSEIISDYKELIDLTREFNRLDSVLHIDTAQTGYDTSETYTDEAKAKTEKEFKELEILIEEKRRTLEEKWGDEGKFKESLLWEESYSKDLSTIFDQRMALVEAHWSMRIAAEKNKEQGLLEDKIALENANYKKEREAENKHYEELRKQASEYYEDKLKGLEENSEEYWDIKSEYDEKVREQEQKHQDRLNKIFVNSELNNRKIENDAKDKLLKINAEYYKNTLQEFRDFQTGINNLERKQPVLNSWGIINLKETNKNNEKLLKAYSDLISKIGKKKNQLNNSFEGGLIDKNTYDSTLRELDSFADGVGEKIDKIKYQLSSMGQIEQFASSINQYVQMFGQGLSSIIGSISDIMDAGYERQIEQQEKYIEQYEEQLQKQQDLTKEYADSINSIEEELKTARGDRRDALIDKLNAEMAAQRASLAQEQKIEKQKKKAEEKAKKLEHDQAVAKKKMQLAQAAINMAMSISMAAVNHWPVPAIPMMAMAAATGAAQIAAIASQNIPSYGQGGIIQGKSHKEGGVKVLGGRAEVEGGEFITNKATTAKNVDLLEYINAKHKKISLDDMIDFYGGNKVRKAIMSPNPKTKFASGGMIPTFRNDISINDRLLTAFEDYASRPTVVSVVDIIDRTNAVNEVRTLAGLTD